MNTVIESHTAILISQLMMAYKTDGSADTMLATLVNYPKVLEHAATLHLIRYLGDQSKMTPLVMDAWDCDQFTAAAVVQDLPRVKSYYQELSADLALGRTATKIDPAVEKKIALVRDQVMLENYLYHFNAYDIATRMTKNTVPLDVVVCHRMLRTPNGSLSLLCAMELYDHWKQKGGDAFLNAYKLIGTIAIIDDSHRRQHDASSTKVFDRLNLSLPHVTQFFDSITGRHSAERADELRSYVKRMTDAAGENEYVPQGEGENAVRLFDMLDKASNPDFKIIIGTGSEPSTRPEFFDFTR